MLNGMWCVRTPFACHWFSPQLILERHSLHCSHHSKLTFIYIFDAKIVGRHSCIIGVKDHLHPDGQILK